jgi:hypothetical protein
LVYVPLETRLPAPVFGDKRVIYVVVLLGVGLGDEDFEILTHHSSSLPLPLF